MSASAIDYTGRQIGWGKVLRREGATDRATWIVLCQCKAEEVRDSAYLARVIRQKTSAVCRSCAKEKQEIAGAAGWKRRHPEKVAGQ